MLGWTVEDGVATALLDRPEKRNALDVETVVALTGRLRADGQRALPLVLTGTGTTFCSGFDLSTVGEGATFKAVADEMFASLLAYPAPVIAALNGPAVGMGCVLAACCDLRIGTERSWLEIPAARLGVVLDEVYVARVRDRLGMAVAQLLLVGSCRIDGLRALELGALHAVAEDPLPEARAWASRATSLSSESLAAHKSFVNGTRAG